MAKKKKLVAKIKMKKHLSDKVTDAERHEKYLRSIGDKNN
jgi:hypothetical protein